VDCLAGGAQQNEATHAIFGEKDRVLDLSFEVYGSLDGGGRCGFEEGWDRNEDAGWWG
jgi:hypothetical protein